MPLYTLWESICTLAGANGESVRLSEAIHRSAVPEVVASVEVKRMVDDGLLEREGDFVRLTERGRKSCGEVNMTSPESTTVAPE